MYYFIIAAILVFISAIFGYINVRFLKLPNTIGLMLITIVFTLAVFAISYVDDTLLFAGALHTNFEQLKVQRWPILAFLPWEFWYPPS